MNKLFLIGIVQFKFLFIFLFLFLFFTINTQAEALNKRGTYSFGFEFESSSNHLQSNSDNFSKSIELKFKGNFLLENNHEANFDFRIINFDNENLIYIHNLSTVFYPWPYWRVHLGYFIKKLGWVMIYEDVFSHIPSFYTDLYQGGGLFDFGFEQTLHLTKSLDLNFFCYLGQGYSQRTQLSIKPQVPPCLLSLNYKNKFLNSFLSYLEQEIQPEYPLRGLAFGFGSNPITIFDSFRFAITFDNWKTFISTSFSGMEMKEFWGVAPSLEYKNIKMFIYYGESLTQAQDSNRQRVSGQAHAINSKIQYSFSDSFSVQYQNFFEDIGGSPLFNKEVFLIDVKTEF